MSRTPTVSVLMLLLFLFAPLLRADDVKTGLKTIVTTATTLKNDVPVDPKPAPGVMVHVFAEGGNKALAEGKTDDQGVFLAAVPAGKYRVEVDPPRGATKMPPAKVTVLDNDIMELNVLFIVMRPR